VGQKYFHEADHGSGYIPGGCERVYCVRHAQFCEEPLAVIFHFFQFGRFETPAAALDYGPVELFAGVITFRYRLSSLDGRAFIVADAWMSGYWAAWMLKAVQSRVSVHGVTG
jgi:hypothetical protein